MSEETGSSVKGTHSIADDGNSTVAIDSVENNRKRTSRWSDHPPSSDGGDQRSGRARKRKSRWGDQKEKVDLPEHAAAAVRNLTSAQREVYLGRLNYGYE